MLGYIFNKISGKVTIDVNPELLVFTRRDRSIGIATFLYLSNNNGTYKIQSIGEECEGSGSFSRVELFRDGPNPGESYSRSELLEAFLRYGLKKVIGRNFMRPTVIFQGTQTLDSILAGYQDAILSKTALNAGAHEVEFTAS